MFYGMDICCFVVLFAVWETFNYLFRQVVLNLSRFLVHMKIFAPVRCHVVCFWRMNNAIFTGYYIEYTGSTIYGPDNIPVRTGTTYIWEQYP